MTENTAPTFIVSDGTQATDFGGYEYGQSIIQQSDGKLVFVGRANGDFALARYNLDGSLDTSFDGDGKLTTDFVVSVGANRIIQQADGKLVVAGDSYDAAKTYFVLARYNLDGSLDVSFDGDGKLVTDLEGSDAGYSIIQQVDGKLVVAGSSYNGSDYNFALARYNLDGSLDTSFDGDGKLTTDFGKYDGGYSIIQQTDGKFIVAGYSYNGSGADFALARYNLDGSLDTSFDGDGKLTTDFGGDDLGFSIIQQADGKLVAAGNAISNSGLDFALARYNLDGSLDTSFDGDGKLTTDFGGSDGGVSIIQQADGKLVISGASETLGGSNSEFALARYNLDGSLDTSFEGDGKLTTDFAGYDYGHSIIQQTDGKLVVAGTSRTERGSDFVLARYNLDGSLDKTFTPAENTLLAKSPIYTEGYLVTNLAQLAQVFDSELNQIGNYNGATLIIKRSGGADIGDIFSNTGTLSNLVEGRYFSVDSKTIGQVTQNSGGILIFSYNANATQALVDKSLSQIAYRNTSDNPPPSVQLDWTFDDGNAGTQGSGGPLSTTQTVTVTITPVNDKPYATIGEQEETIAPNVEWSWDLPAGAFFDPDDGDLTYALKMADGTGVPPWILFNSTTGRISGTPSREDAGTLHLRVSASDPHSTSANLDLLINIAANNAPVLAIPIADQSTPEDATWIFAVPVNAFSDLDGDAFSYSASLTSGSALPAWLSFAAATRTFTGTPLADFNGSLHLKVTASDGVAAASDTFTLTVTPVNDAPVVANPIADQSTPEEAAWSFTVPANAFSDVDNAALSWSSTQGDGSALPAWLTFDAATHSFTGTPPANYHGSFNVKVTVSDGTSSASDTFKLTVASVNDVPVVTPLSQNLETGFETAVAFTLSASDADGDTLSFIAGTPQHGSVGGGSGGAFTYTPATKFNGQDSFTVTVSDGNGGSAAQTINVTVGAPPNQPPAFPSPTQSATATAGQVVVVPVAASDADGDALTYAAGTAAKGNVVLSNGQATYTADPFASGSDSFTVTASDGHGGNATQTIEVTIDAASALPPAVFRLITAAGWTGSVGGNGTIAGANGFDDLTVLHGSLTLDGSFNRGGDLLRFTADAADYAVGRSGSSTAVITDNLDLRVAVPLGTTGLVTHFDDGNRTLSVAGGAKLGSQALTTTMTPITAPDDGSALPTGDDPLVQVKLIITGSAMQPWQQELVEIGGRVKISGTNGAEVVRLAWGGGDFTFDGSFNRGGDTVILNHEATAYTAVRQGSSTIVIQSADERLAIPIGTAGLTLHFADGERVLIVSGGQVRIGEQAFSGATPVQLSPYISTKSLDQGSDTSAVTLSGAAGKVLFTDDAAVTGNTVLQHFASDDLIKVTHAAADDYNFTVNGTDLEITYTSAGGSNTIVITGALETDEPVFDYASASAALGWSFMSFG